MTNKQYRKHAIVRIMISNGKVDIYVFQNSHGIFCVIFITLEITASGLQRSLSKCANLRKQVLERYGNHIFTAKATKRKEDI